LAPAYAGVVFRLETVVHVPFTRTCTVSHVNHPPSQNSFPSWNTTRSNVCGLAKV
jgi:hypothetical protein